VRLSKDLLGRPTAVAGESGRGRSAKRRSRPPPEAAQDDRRRRRRRRRRRQVAPLSWRRPNMQGHSLSVSQT